MNDEDKKTLEVIGQWSMVSGNMRKFSKSVGHNVSTEKVTQFNKKNHEEK